MRMVDMMYEIAFIILIGFSNNKSF
jgi:hypothetical protein